MVLASMEPVDNYSYKYYGKRKYYANIIECNEVNSNLLSCK